jgi:cytochrome c
MRPMRRTTLYATVAAAAFALAAAVAVNEAVSQDDDEDADPTGERARVAAAALSKAEARGRELWTSKSLGKKACASCHEDPEKPNIDLRTRKWDYPAYSRRKRQVLTLQQKINEMVVYNNRGKPFDLDSTDAAALAAYVVSLKRK